MSVYKFDEKIENWVFKINPYTLTQKWLFSFDLAQPSHLIQNKNNDNFSILLTI
jgi:hypothetical protein